MQAANGPPRPSSPAATPHQASTPLAFQRRKESCLSKRDKSSAGRIDPRAVDICAAINDRAEYYTTSSCAGRCFLYRGDGIKSHHHFVAADADGNAAAEEEEADADTDAADAAAEDNAAAEIDGERAPQGHGYFERYRMCHDLIRDPLRYFDLSTLDPDASCPGGYDPTGGGDPVRSIGQYDHREVARAAEAEAEAVAEAGADPRRRSGPEHERDGNDSGSSIITDGVSAEKKKKAGAIWLRFEPFILHVACRTLLAASSLMSAARPSFKNVGLTSWKHGHGKYIVAIWGDEGLDMPLCAPDDQKLEFYRAREGWLADLVNERHRRNWAKIDRFVEGVRAMKDEAEESAELAVEEVGGDEVDVASAENGAATDQTIRGVPKRFDVVGDVAILNTMPPGDEAEVEAVGLAIMAKSKAIKVCVARTSSLRGTERSAAGPRVGCSGADGEGEEGEGEEGEGEGDSGLQIIAGARRSPLITSHVEYGIKCVVDLERTFFSPRMGPERLRICQQVARGEKVLVLFCGVGMDAMQIAGRTEASEVIAVELNPVAVECARRGHRMLVRNKAVKTAGAADRLRIVEGDVLDVLPTLELGTFDRIVAPRPKEGKQDGDLGDGDGGVAFLEAMLPLLKTDGGECHWYDFAADRELPRCERTRRTIESVCDKAGLEMEVIHVAQVGSVAKRQFRVCVDFRLVGRKNG